MIIIFLLCFLGALILYKGKKIYQHLSFVHEFPKFQTIKFRNTPEFKKAKWLPVDGGKLPLWLNGIMYRIGPGKYVLGEGTAKQYTIKHAFDGLPYMHRFEIAGKTQKVRYNSCNLSENVEKTLLERGDQGRLFFGHLTYESTWQRLRSIFKRLMGLKRAVNASSEMVGVTPTPNFPMPKGWSKEKTQILVAKTDANILQQVNAEALVPEKIFRYDVYDEKLKGELAAAHHQYDPITKESFNFILEIRAPKFIVFSIDSQGKTTILAEITHRMDSNETPVRPAYIHSFWLTKDYIVLPEYPLYYTNGGLDLLLNGSVVSSLEYDSSTPTYLHIVSRKPGVGHIATAKVDPFFMFHAGNGWNEGNDLFLDGVVFSNGDILQEVHSFGVPVAPGEHPKYNMASKSIKRGFQIPPRKQSGLGKLHRYIITLLENGQASASCKELADNIEFPRFSQEYTSKRYSYLYGTAFSQATEKEAERFSIVKLDLKDPDNVQTIKYGQSGYFCSEPIFVPGPTPTEEDAGVLLTFVNAFSNRSDKNDCCFLVVLDAKNLTELARCSIGDFTATTFHGSFVDHEFKNVSIN